MTNRYLQIVVATVAMAITASSLTADTIVFDPDGSGNSPKVNLTTFQFGAGNTLYRGALPFTVGNTFQLLFHGQLNSVVNNAGVQLVPSGLNATGAVGAVSPFEITVVGSVTESVTNLNSNAPPRATFRLANTQAPNSFVELYYDGNQNANPLQGTGYNDGTLILRGTPLPSQPDVGTFSLTNPEPAPLPPFDSFVTNNYTNVTSVVGVGATKLAVVVTTVDSAFFVAPGNGDTGRQVHIGDIVTLDVSAATPFDKVDPSMRFTTAANSGNGSGPTPTATPLIGSSNGSGVDLQAQSLIATTINPPTTPTPTPTPTPGTTPTPTVSPTATPSTTPTPTATPTGVKVVISANKLQVREGNDVTITFTVKGATTHPAFNVNYSVAGNATLNTDYTLSGTPGVVTIPANALSASITLHSIADTVKEPNGEAAKIVLQPGTGYDLPAQDDAKRVSIIIVDPAT